MSDKELRSMDKTQLLKIMRQQELEIEKLTAERNELAKRVGEEPKPVRSFNIERMDSPEDSLAVAGSIIQSAQEAADLYLKNMKLLENKNMNPAFEQPGYSGNTVHYDSIENIDSVDSVDSIENIDNSENSGNSGNGGNMAVTEKYTSDEIETAIDLRLVSYLYMNLIDKAHNTLHEMLERYKLTAKLPQINEIQENSRQNEITQTGDHV